MKRTLVAGAWLLGSIVPLTGATLFLVGCCVLPFHQALHKVVPLCDIAATLGAPEHSSATPDSTPARDKTEQTAKSVPTELTARVALVASDTTGKADVLRSHLGFRSFISLGALRCDEDVGAHLSTLNTFRI